MLLFDFVEAWNSSNTKRKTLDRLLNKNITRKDRIGHGLQLFKETPLPKCNFVNYIKSDFCV